MKIALSFQRNLTTQDYVVSTLELGAFVVPCWILNDKKVKLIFPKIELRKLYFEIELDVQIELYQRYRNNYSKQKVWQVKLIKDRLILDFVLPQTDCLSFLRKHPHSFYEVGFNRVYTIN